MRIIKEQTTGSFGLDHKNLPERAFFSFQELYEEGLHVEKQAKIQKGDGIMKLVKKIEMVLDAYYETFKH